VLVPTRELAMQVSDTLAPLAQSAGLTVQLVAGGLPIAKQITALRRGVDIVVATPGRLKDLIERRACALSDVEIAVLDEADHMADLGFLPAVRELLDLTQPGGQRLLFSATLDGDVATLVEAYLHDPDVHALSASIVPVANASHYLFRISREAKSDVVAQIAARHGRTILFVRTKHGADRLANNLARAGVSAAALHGGRTQAQRTRALNSFRDGRVNTLVATDVAARGIHVDDVSLVLHVDPPQDAKDYLHRSGRTARAGNSGVVVVLATPQEERGVRRMLTTAAVRAEQRDVAPGDAELHKVTGARTPSGKPVAERTERVERHRAPRPHRPGNKRRVRESSVRRADTTPRRTNKSVKQRRQPSAPAR
jgi:superfamily II DNA/RNA helicase